MIKKAETGRSPWAEGTSNSRDKDATAMRAQHGPHLYKEDHREWCFTTWRWYKWTASTSRTTNTSDHCGWQHVPKHRSTNLTIKLTLQQGATSCSCTSTDQFSRTGDQNFLCWSSPGMVAHQERIQDHAQKYSSLNVRHQGKSCSKSWTLEGSWFLVERQWGR